MDKYIGIDISKQTFDAYGSDLDRKTGFSHFEQTTKGYQGLLKKYGNDKTYVMEATGPYSLKLAMYLFKKNIEVSMINPLIIRRYSQMQLQRAKTDKKDAKTIHDYACNIKVNLWAPPSRQIFDMQHLLTALELITKQKTSTTNQLKAFQASGVLSAELKRSLKSIIEKFKREIKKLEKQLEDISKTHFPETRKLILSVPGFGKKAVAVLIAATNNFEKFLHYKQFIAFAGTSPRVYQSGTSVNGKGHICKMGNGHIRKQLYISALSAMRYNKACRILYERLTAKGKHDRVAKIAVANKLIKQIFAIVADNEPYSEEHISKLKVALP